MGKLLGKKKSSGKTAKKTEPLADAVASQQYGGTRATGKVEKRGKTVPKKGLAVATQSQNKSLCGRRAQKSATPAPVETDFNQEISGSENSAPRGGRSKVVVNFEEDDNQVTMEAEGDASFLHETESDGDTSRVSRSSNNNAICTSMSEGDDSSMHSEDGEISEHEAPPAKKACKTKKKMGNRLSLASLDEDEKEELIQEMMKRFEKKMDAPDSSAKRPQVDADRRARAPQQPAVEQGKDRGKQKASTSSRDDEIGKQLRSLNLYEDVSSGSISNQ